MEKSEAKTRLRRYKPFFMVGVVYLAVVQVALLWFGIAGGAEGRADFRSFFAAGRMVRSGQGHAIYDQRLAFETQRRLAGTNGADLPFTHPSYEALAFAPLAGGSYATGYWIFFGLNVACLLAAYRLLLPAAEWMNTIGKWLPWAVAGSFLPVGVCLVQGQDSLLLLALVAGFCVLEKKKQEFAAGMLLGLGVFRFQLVIPLVVLLIFARRWKMAVGFAAASALAVAGSMWVSGAAWLVEYPRLLATISGTMQTGDRSLALAIAPTAMANLRGLFTLAGGTWAPDAAVKLATIGVSAGLMAWAAWKRVGVELMMVVAVLVSYHGQIHDSVVLLVPLLCCGIGASEGGRGKKLVAWGAMAAGPAVAFAFGVPYAVLAVVYLAFLVAMARGEEGKAGLVEGTA